MASEKRPGVGRHTKQAAIEHKSTAHNQLAFDWRRTKSADKRVIRVRSHLEKFFTARFSTSGILGLRVSLTFGKTK